MTEQILEHSNALEVDPELISSLFDVMITDPPYSEHVHSSATSQSAGGGTRKRDLGFVSLTRRARSAVAHWSTLVKRWSVVYSDVESANWLAIAAQARGAEYIRTMPWVRWSMPQLSGDRPPQGFESLVVLHRQQVGKRGGRKPMAKHWNGPGNLVALTHTCLRGEDKHKSEKPLDQALDLVSWFSDPGEWVFDPFAGSFTLALACALLERNYYGTEWGSPDSERWVDFGRARLENISGRDAGRIRKWLDTPHADPDNATPPSLERAARRQADRERVRGCL